MGGVFSGHYTREKVALKLLLHCWYNRSPLLFNVPSAHDLLSLDIPVTRGEAGAGAVSIACGNRDM